MIFWQIERRVKSKIDMDKSSYKSEKVIPHHKLTIFVTFYVVSYRNKSS